MVHKRLRSKKTLSQGSVFLCVGKRKIKIISYFKCKNDNRRQQNCLSQKENGGKDYE